MIKIFTFLLAFSVCTLGAPRPRFAKNIPVLIVGGQDATRHEFPYLAVLSYFGTPLCVATIIRNDILVTSASCIEAGGGVSSFSVKAGKHNINEAETTEQTRALTSIVIHPNRGSSSEFSNDIAILKADAPFRFNGAVAPLPLAHKGHTAEGNATILGWGDTSENASAPHTDILQKAQVPIVSDLACREAYGVAIIEDNMICAGFPEGGVDVCYGDAGGPLVARDLGFRYFAGIVSFGLGCARPGYPSVYTEIAHHIDFIAANAA